MLRLETTRVRICALTLVLACVPAAAAFAEPGEGLRAMAEAYQKQYREMRKTGAKNLTGDRVKEIHNQAFGPAMRKLNEDRALMLNTWKTMARDAFSGMKVQATDGPQAAGGAGGGGGGAGSGEGPGASARAGTDTSTGEQAGAGGAKKVQFGGADKAAAPQKSKHVNEDGIIMRR